MRAPGLLLPILFAAASTLGAAAADPATDPAAWLRALDAATPETAERPVRDLQLEFGPARLRIESGTLIPVRGPSTRPQEILFFGKARFVLATDDPIETYQIDLFTGAEKLDEPVSQGVFVIADDKVMDQLTARAAEPLAPERGREAAALLTSWRQSREYLRGDVRLLAHADAVGDRPAQRFVAAWLDTPRLGRFLLHVDPYAPSRARVEQFVPFRLSDIDRDAYRKWIRREQQEGRQLERDPDDLGDWNVWFSERAAGRESFEPRHYDLGLGIGDPLEPVQGKTVVDLTAKSDGARVIAFTLHPDLKADGVIGPEGPLPWGRMRDRLAVVLPAQVLAGDEIRIEIRYSGILFEKDYDGTLSKRTTSSWYPRTGSIDRATYRAEFTSPKTLTLLASGRKTSETPEGTIVRQVRVLDKPSAMFGFELGKFKVMQKALGHVALEIGFLSDERTASAAARDRTIEIIGQALETYEASFGPYPLDVLTVATTRYSFSQGFLSFVTLADPIVQRVDDNDWQGPDRRRIIAHEIAHQWWGNMVGWASDRDVWLSESLANYAAAVFRNREGSAFDGAYLDLVAQEELMGDQSLADRPLEALGPIILGPRLDSSLSDDAYHAVVYQKGAMVMALLAEQLGEKPLLAMLKEIAQRANFRPLDTETVFQALGKMSGRDLEPFTRAFVYGVGFPSLEYRYEMAKAEGGYEVRGQARLQPQGFRRDRLAQEDGRFVLRPTFRTYQTAEAARATISAVLTFTDPAASPVRTGSIYVEGEPTQKQVLGRRTRLEIAGAETPITYRSEQQPVSLVLDPRHLLPAAVIDVTKEPKRALVARAASLRSRGLAADARAAYAEALALRLPSLPAGVFASRKNDLAWWNDRLDGRIHLDLAELALDLGEIDVARRELADRTVDVVVDAEAITSAERWWFGSAVEAIRRPETQRDVLRARIALAEGDAASAYKFLKGALALDVTQNANDTVFDAMRKKKLAGGAVGVSGDYLLYAAAAHASGHEDVCREATAEARRRGGDPGVLDELHAASAAR